MDFSIYFEPIIVGVSSAFEWLFSIGGDKFVPAFLFTIGVITVLRFILFPITNVSFKREASSDSVVVLPKTHILTHIPRK